MKDQVHQGTVVSGGLTVHALFQGLPLCGFSQDVPANWPPGNVWTEIGDIENINCRSCKEKAERWAKAKK